ncbi:MAG: heme exporter protein CcmB [Dehalococcoidia bacterium]|nr:heme exporter protein CcmB [Dehalococcoidia bacterium]
MKRSLIAIKTMVWKDLLLELKSKDVIISIVSFALLALVIFNFAFGSSSQLASLIAPGAIWVSITFAGVIGLNRLFVIEHDQGSIVGLLLTPVSRDSIYFGKMLSMFVFLTISEIILLPIYAILFNTSITHPIFLLIVVLGTIGFASLGTLFSAMAVNTRSREIMLPVMFLPIVMPILIGSVVASANILDGGGWSDAARGIHIIIVFDVLSLVVSPLLFEQIMQE